MKKKLLILAAVCILAVLVTGIFTLQSRSRRMPEDSGPFGAGLSWAFDADTGTLTISGKGDMPDMDSEDPAPWSQYAEDISHVVVEKGITRIGDFTFFEQNSLRSVRCERGIREIGFYAFGRCDSLEEVSLSRGLKVIEPYAFESCDSLTRIRLPYGVENISGGFYGCSGLESVFLPDTVTDITSAFTSCSSLVSIRVPGSVTEGRTAFQYCQALKEVVLEAGNRTVYFGMFADCSALEAVSLPYGLEIVDASAFAHCEKLTSVTIPKTVTELGQGAFDRTGLKEITIPGSISRIPWDCFMRCPQLETLVVREGVTHIDPYAFACCSSLKEIHLPDSLVSLSAGAFNKCIALEEVTLPKNLSELPTAGIHHPTSDIMSYYNIPIHGIFRNCRNLRRVVILCDPAVIHPETFERCPALEILAFPDRNAVLEGCWLSQTCLPYTIQGHPGSATEAFAQAEGYPFQPLRGW